jgi:hypothetical protein
MRASPLTSTSDHWTEPSYEIRVRGIMYLWGSAGIRKNVAFDKPLILHVRNDVFGAPITIGTQAETGIKTDFGTLQPGECVSIPVQNITGVYADCDQESAIACLIKGA